MATEIRAPAHADSGSEADADATATTPLTDRETEVLACVARGDSDRAVATQLGISVHTVRSHLRAVFTKTGLRNRTAAAAWYYGQSTTRAPAWRRGGSAPA